MFEIIIGIIIGTAGILFYKKFHTKSEQIKIEKDKYQSALNEMQLMQNFVEDPERIKRWKLIQFKCQYFTSAYKDDKKSTVPEISEVADKKLEEWINGRLDEVFAIKDDEYCQSASFDAIATFLASVGQFDRAEKVINLITVDIIKQNAQDKYNELRGKTENATDDASNKVDKIEDDLHKAQATREANSKDDLSNI